MLPHNKMKDYNVQKILKCITTNNIEDLIQITKEFGRPSEKDVNHFLSQSNLSEIHNVIENWGLSFNKDGDEKLALDDNKGTIVCKDLNEKTSNCKVTSKRSIDDIEMMKTVIEKENASNGMSVQKENKRNELVSSENTNLENNKIYQTEKNVIEPALITTEKIECKENKVIDTEKNPTKQTLLATEKIEFKEDKIHDVSQKKSNKQVLITTEKIDSKGNDVQKAERKSIKRTLISTENIYSEENKMGEIEKESIKPTLIHDGKINIDENETEKKSYKRKCDTEGNNDGETISKEEPQTKKTKTDVNNKNENPHEVIKRYSFNDQLKDKIMVLFYDVFIKNIKSCSYEQAGDVSQSIVKEIIKNNKFNDKKFIATKKLNLNNPKNVVLCYAVYNNDITPEKFVLMSVDEMKSEELKKQEQKIIQNSICDSQLAKPIADSNMFKCSKCHQTKTTFYQLQTRSGDEPMTTFVTCCTCGKRWKF